MVIAMKRSLVAAPLLLILLGAQAAPPVLQVKVERLRNPRGVIHLCLTRNPAHFPDCGSDPAALKQSIPAANARAIRLSGFRPGSYALSLFHDENRNGKLDTMLGIPREGFGFSGNPVVRFGPPTFKRVKVEIGSGIALQTIRMQYLL